MKYSLFILFIFALPFFTMAQGETYQGKTINVTDANNLKQGLWIKFDPADKTKKIEEGTYKDSKKDGIWKEYYSNGNLKSEITWVAGKADGYAKMYYENGKINEEGVWKGTKWVGSYKFYHENGKPKYEFAYNDDGKRTGKQKYFHENGQLAIEGEWKEGKEAGVIKEYFPNGQLKSEKKFENGVLDEGSVKTFAENESKPVVENKKVETKKEEVKKEEKKVEVKEEKTTTKPEKITDYKSYLSELAKKYPEGVTSEEYKEGNNTILRVIVVKDKIANEYKKVSTPWGQILYQKNGQSVSGSVFNMETRKK